MIDARSVVQQLHGALLQREASPAELDRMEPIADEAGGIQRCVEQLFASEEFGRRYRHRPIFAIVAHEFGRYNGHGGIAVYLENLIDSLIAHSNYHIHLFCHGLGPYRPSPRLTVTHIPDGDLKSADFVAQALDRIDPQVVEVADYNGLTSQFLLRRAMGQTHSKCRIIVNHHTGSREIWEWGTLTDFDAVASTDLRFTAIAEAAQNSLADAHVSVSAFLASYLEQRYHLPRITPLYPCFPQAEADSTSSAGNRDGLHILSLGRFELRKRQDLLIRACTELLREGMHLHVTFAGNSIEDFRSGEDYRTACYALIDRDLRDHFTFHDFLSPQASHPLFAQADLFVIPSPRENFPTTALEAITQGLPVCGSRTSGVAELMGADTSLLFAPDDIAAIKQALRHAADIGQPGLDAIAQEQRLRTRALLAPETAIAARLAHFDTVVPRSLDQIISHPPVLALLPAAMADTAPHARAAGQVEMFGNEPLTRRPIPDGGLFLYCPTPPSDDILQAMLEQAGSADFLDEQTLICCAPDLKKGLDRTRMLAQHVTYPIIGRICLEPSKGQPPRTSDQLVADALLRATKLFYLYCPGAKAGPMSRAITARLDEKLFPFQNPVT